MPSLTMCCLVFNCSTADIYELKPRPFTSQGAVGTNITVDTLCSMMSLQVFGDVLHRYARINKLIMDTYEQKCLSSNYKAFIQDMKATSWDASIAEGGWRSLLFYDSSEMYTGFYFDSKYCSFSISRVLLLK